MVVTVKVEGFEAFITEVEKQKGKTVIALFSGSVGEEGKSWCPDCVTAVPVVEECAQNAPDDVVYIYCGVGGMNFWKDQNNVFRKDKRLLLKCVPTLLKYGTPQRLGEEECSKKDLVAMFFEED